MDLRLSTLAAVGVAVAGALAALASPSAAGAGEPELTLDSREAIEIAREDESVRRLESERGPLDPAATAKPPDTWQVSFRDSGEQVAQVHVDDASGTVRESWTGYQAGWQMARGREGAFGGVLNAPWVWLPLCAAFFFGLLDFRRPWRIVHLDLAVLLGFGISHFFFNRGEIGLSVPLVYPVLLYLLARMLWVGARGSGLGLRPTVPALWLGAGAAFLLAFRIAVNVADSGVIDVGYAGVIGADLLTSGESLYGEGAFPADNPFGDTYGFANYLLYVPFELAFPWSGEWDQLPAAHAAAIFFDLAVAAALLALGWRLRSGAAGLKLAATLVFAWAAFPYAAYTLASNSNDAAVAALIAWSLVVFTSPAARGALLALAAGVKFAPLALVPLYAAGTRGFRIPRPGWAQLRPRRSAAVFAAAVLATAAALLVYPALESGLGSFWERTIANQLDRESPFSVWGQAGLEPLQRLVQLAAVALAVALAFIPGRREIARIAALVAAVLIVIQLPVDHWFYLYIVWFFPPLILALALGKEQNQPSTPLPKGSDPL